jgi:hypothetical protein
MFPHNLENHNEKQLTRFNTGLQKTSCGGRARINPLLVAKFASVFLIIKHASKI